MSAGQFTSGPIEHFVQFRGESIAYYLGTAVLGPEQDDDEKAIPILNDLGGRSVPFQVVQDGAEWMITTTMNRFDMSVLRRLRGLTSAGPGQFPVLGVESGRARGTLVLGNSDFSLILANSYAGTPSAGVATPADLNALRGFYSCKMLHYKESSVGTRVVEVSLAIQAYNLFDPVTRGFRLFSETNVWALGPTS